MRNLTEGNIYKNFILFAIPMILAGLLSQAYATIDTAIAGKYLGDEGLAAIGSTSALITFVSSLFWGLSSGFSVYVASLFGAGEYKKIKNVIFTGVITFCAIGILVSALLIIFKAPIFSLLNIKEEMAKSAGVYFVVYIAGIVAVLLNTLGVLLMNAFGVSAFPFAMSVVSAVLNVSGNVFTIIVLDWGLFGLALSSVVAALVVDICYLVKFISCFRQLGVGSERAKYAPRLLLPSGKYAITNMLQQIIMYVSGFIVSPFVNSIGQSATASYTVSHRVYEINASIYQNSSKTLANFTAQASGMGEKRLLKKGVKVGFLQGFAVSLPFLLVCIFFPEFITSLFFGKKAEPEAMNYTIEFLTKFMPLLVFNIVANLYHAFFRGLGEKPPLVVSTLVGSLSRVVFSIVLIPSLGMTGMYIGWSVSWLADALAGAIFYKTYKIKKEL